MRETLWQFAASLGIALIATVIIVFALIIIPADAAILPKAESPLSLAKQAKEAQQTEGLCIEVQTRRRFLVLPNRKWEPLTAEKETLVPCS